MPNSEARMKNTIDKWIWRRATKFYAADRVRISCPSNLAACRHTFSVYSKRFVVDGVAELCCAHVRQTVPYVIELFSIFFVWHFHWKFHGNTKYSMFVRALSSVRDAAAARCHALTNVFRVKNTVTFFLFPRTDLAFVLLPIFFSGSLSSFL